MKRGRRPLREHFRQQILEALATNPYPITAAGIKKVIDAKTFQPCGWHTVRKYLGELVTEKLVLRQALPSNAGRKPLVIYLGRSRPNQQR